MFAKVIQLVLSLLHTTGSLLIVWPYLSRSLRRPDQMPAVGRWLLRRLTLPRGSRRLAHQLLALAAVMEVSILIAALLFVADQNAA